MTRPDPDAVRAALDEIAVSFKPDSAPDIVARELTFLQTDWINQLATDAKQVHAISQVKGIIEAQADIPQDAKDLLAQATAVADVAAAADAVIEVTP